MTTPSRHYKRAPITEAVLAFQCELPDPLTLGALADVHSKLKARYPKRADQYQMGFRLQQATPPIPVTESAIMGYKLARGDEKRTVYLTILGDFAFSWLAPYDRWDTFRAEAKQAWDAYESIISPKRIKRIGVRFINRLDIPAPPDGAIDLDLYLRTGPRIAPELPQQMKTYFVRVELQSKHPNGLLIITEATAAPPGPNIISSLLDIDALVQNVNLSAADAWSVADDLRREKNEAFEACITDSVRSLIE